MAVNWAYLLFVPLAALCFALLSVRAALLSVMIGGWWGLPVEHYPAFDLADGLPWTITGIALPGERLLTKAWIPPLIGVIGAAARDPAALRRWRPGAIDLPIGLWCLWPLLDGGVGADPMPPAASLYLVGAWGLPWLAGRVWLSGPEGMAALLRGLALSGLANLPVAVIEGMKPARLYGVIYGPHPFAKDGVERYIGYRPIGFFEHGNLYGLWAALAAFAAIWLARRVQGRAGWVVVAVVDTAIALASQSFGALVLAAAALAVLVSWRSRVVLPVLVGTAALLGVIAVVHLSGIVPVQSLRHTPLGERVIGMVRATGRGSFLWRISQDSKTLPGIDLHPLGGAGRWDWFRVYGTRPWGQAMLLIGQYGLIGVALAWGSLLAAATRAIIGRRGGSGVVGAALPLALVVLAALADATMNAAFFSPAIAAAGAIAGRSDRTGG